MKLIKYLASQRPERSATFTSIVWILVAIMYYTYPDPPKWMEWNLAAAAIGLTILLVCLIKFRR